MSIDEIIEIASEAFARLSRLPVCAIIGLSKMDGGWTISLEALERKAIPDTMDVLGLYEVNLDGEANLLGFERKRLRKRCQSREE